MSAERVVAHVLIEPEDLQELVRHAYLAGCRDVHENYQEDADPDFTEASYDYVASLDFTETTKPYRGARDTWRPIESAPRDGTEIILRRDQRIGGGFWITWPDTETCEGGEGWSVGADGCHWDDAAAPTHWQPLPTPPLRAELLADANSHYSEAQLEEIAAGDRS
jgi:hypothetical protein